MLAWPVVLGVLLDSTVGWQCAEPLSGWVGIDEVRSENINIVADGALSGRLGMVTMDLLFLALLKPILSLYRHYHLIVTTYYVHERYGFRGLISTWYQQTINKI